MGTKIVDVSSVAIRAEIPESTAALENARSPNCVSADEMLQCYAGHISIVDRSTGIEIIGFHDAPVLRFASDIAEAVGRMRGGALSWEFFDFYGTFRVTFARDLSGTVVMTSAWDQRGIRTSISALRMAVLEFLDDLALALARKIPGITENGEFHALMRIARARVSE